MGKATLAACLVVAALLSVTCAAFAYEENFNLVPAGTIPSDWRVLAGSWSVVQVSPTNRVVQNIMAQPDAWDVLHYRNGYTWTDYRLTVDERFLPDTPASSGVWIGGRLNNSNQGYLLHRVRATARSYVELYASGVGTPLGVYDFVGDLDWHSFTLQFTGSNIRVFVDGGSSAVINVNDARYTAGTIGFTVNPDSHAEFDNVVVNESPVPEPSGLAILATGLAGAAGLLRRRIFSA